MASSAVAAFYKDALDAGSPISKNWILMNPIDVLLIIIAYLIAVFFGIRYMKDPKRKAFSIHSAMIGHNVLLAALSAYMCIETLRQAAIGRFSLFGNGLDNTARGIPLASVLWLYYASKILEFGDTFIMIAKQNFHQITFLHVYHHASIFAIWWACIYYAPGGETYFTAALNSFIHVLMYSYYLWAAVSKKAGANPDAAAAAAAAKPTWREPAFYRPWVTRSQMIQFVIMFCQASYDLYFPVPNYPRFLCWILFFYMMTMLALFGNFYIQAYKKGSSRRAGGGGAGGDVALRNGRGAGAAPGAARPVSKKQN